MYGVQKMSDIINVAQYYEYALQSHSLNWGDAVKESHIMENRAICTRSGQEQHLQELRLL